MAFSSLVSKFADGVGTETLGRPVADATASGCARFACIGRILMTVLCEGIYMNGGNILSSHLVIELLVRSAWIFSPTFINSG